MKEELTAGGKEFIFVLLWAAMFYILCGCIMSLFGEYAFIGGIISVIVFAVFGYFVLIHYTARFTYQLRDGRLRINRMIGKRNREVDFACGDIKGMYYGFKPRTFPKRVVTNWVTPLILPSCMALLSDWQYISQMRLEHPITLVGLTALSVEIMTNFLVPYLTARSAMTRVP